LISKLHSHITKLAGAISIFMLILLSLTLFAGVIARYVFSYSIPELEVIRKFSLMWLVFIGSALAVKEKLHLEIDIFSDYLDEKKIRVKNIIVYVLSLFGIIILILVGFAAFKSGLNRTELVPIRFLSSPPSLIYYYSAFVIGAVFMLYFHLANAKELFDRTEVKKK
jgi:TRAP-type C4-dicarboxylate transport system permease small subunit